MEHHTWRSLMRVLSLALFALVAMKIGFFPAAAPAHDGPTQAKPEPDSCSVLGWVPYWDQERAVASFRKHVGTIDYLSLFWYNLDPDGNVQKYKDAQIDHDIIDFAHDNGVKVFVLVANLPDDQREGDHDWDPDRVGAVIGSEEERQAHVSALLALAEKLKVDGINIDYEALPEKYRADFSTFIRELSEALHANDKLLAVALHPKTSETNPAEDNGSHAQDWNELAKYADQLHLMTYGEHNSGTHPGPIASPDWVEPVVRYARDVHELPAEKLFLGIPLYAEAWEPLKSGGYRAARVDLTYSDIERVRKKYVGGTLNSDRYDTPSFIFKTSGGRKRIVWFENRASVQRKLAVGREFGVCNFAFWRLGGEDPRIWDSVDQAVKTDE